jgi:hypothetical protein
MTDPKRRISAFASPCVAAVWFGLLWYQQYQAAKEDQQDEPEVVNGDQKV